MASKKPTKTSTTKASQPPMTPETKAKIQRIIGHLGGAMAFIGLCAGGLYVSNRYVQNNVFKSNSPPVAIMANRPLWMSDTLAEQILDSVQPKVPALIDDQRILIDRATLLAANPWVRRVNQIRRAFRDAPGDTIEIDCEFRAPVAMVRWQDEYWYVDAQGVRLPEKFSPQQVDQMLAGPNGPILRAIDGVMTPPPAFGKPWGGDEVQAGIELLALVSTRPFAPDILRVNVSNFAGRVNPNESQLNLITRNQTEVRWGQPISAKGFYVEAKVEQKLNFLMSAKQQTGRVDMNQPWIDLRFDNPTVPQPQANVGH